MIFTRLGALRKRLSLEPIPFKQGWPRLTLQSNHIEVSFRKTQWSHTGQGREKLPRFRISCDVLLLSGCVLSLGASCLIFYALSRHCTLCRVSEPTNAETTGILLQEHWWPAMADKQMELKDEKQWTTGNKDKAPIFGPSLALTCHPIAATCSTCHALFSPLKTLSAVLPMRLSSKASRAMWQVEAPNRGEAANLWFLAISCDFTFPGRNSKLRENSKLYWLRCSTIS